MVCCHTHFPSSSYSLLFQINFFHCCCCCSCVSLLFCFVVSFCSASVLEEKRHVRYWMKVMLHRSDSCVLCVSGLSELNEICDTWHNVSTYGDNGWNMITIANPTSTYRCDIHSVASLAITRTHTDTSSEYIYSDFNFVCSYRRTLRGMREALVCPTG